MRDAGEVSYYPTWCRCHHGHHTTMMMYESMKDLAEAKRSKRESSDFRQAMRRPSENLQ